MEESDPDAFPKYAEAEKKADEVRRTSEELREKVEDLIKEIRHLRTRGTHDPSPDTPPPPAE